jgi:1,4-dihydroxy-2-naphthoate octaprenyltransferase
MNSQRYRAGVWRLADPKISLASFAGLFLAACFAAADAELYVGWLALTVLGIFSLEVAKNASGEIVDFDSGTDAAVAPQDRSPFSGGKRVLVDSLLTRKQTAQIAVFCYATACAIGLVIAVGREMRILPICALGLGLAWFYHGGTVRLSYRGLGELAVALAYGPLLVSGAYLVQTGYLSAPLLHAGMALGLLVAAFLWINQFPDLDADRTAGKRNLVVRLGRERAALVFAVIVFAAYTILALAAVAYPSGRGMLWGLIGLVPALFAAWRLQQASAVTARLIPAQAATLASFLLMAAATGLGYWA